jgi:uncharacterized protein YndB with AHSA1/START domain
VEIAAPLEVAWEATLLQMSEENEMPDGKKYPMKLEPFPGGRWYRDLGKNTGHYWGHVQVIKPPALLEICGPLFMSFPATNHVQYRLTSEGGKTRLKLTHRSFGNLPRDLGEKGMDEGWEFWLTRVRDIALRLASTRA